LAIQLEDNHSRLLDLIVFLKQIEIFIHGSYKVNYDLTVSIVIKLQTKMTCVFSIIYG